MFQPWAARAVGVTLTTFLLGSLLWRQRVPFTYVVAPWTDTQELPLLHRDFWRHFYADLTASRPNCSNISHNQTLNVVGLDDEPPPRPMEVLLEDEQHRALKTAHHDFVERVLNRTYELAYVPGSRGIVITAGGSYLIHALVTVRMLRRTGTDLPVEVFQRDPAEGDVRICDDIFPMLNAKCVLLSQTLGDDIDKLGKYGYKMIAMLVSSFEEFLYLDADCFPLYSPDVLFTKPPFTTHGLVLWPDFWYPTESPLFFDIANIAMPPMDHSQVASEAGAIMFSKRTHTDSLLIAAYYNFYGPEFYYKLHSQGALGEGDKETFRWSAVASDSPWYQVKSRVKHLGFTTKDGERRDSMMAQYNPMIDLKAGPEEARPFFAHAHNPKLDPDWMFNEKIGTLFDSDGSMRRIWHENATQAMEYFGSGYDAEAWMWEEMRDMACEYEKLFHRTACVIGTRYLEEVFQA
nr:hypothetical protein B0A51_12181 [Rachicladosporium sp. CCFEE 5018]